MPLVSVVCEFALFYSQSGDVGKKQRLVPGSVRTHLILHSNSLIQRSTYVLRVVMPCPRVVIHKRFGEAYCLHPVV
jgi:hypothetical protein